MTLIFTVFSLINVYLLKLFYPYKDDCMSLLKSYFPVPLFLLKTIFFIFLSNNILAGDLDMLKQDDPEHIVDAIHEIGSQLEESTEYVIKEDVKQQLADLISHEDEEVRDAAAYVFDSLVASGESLDKPLMNKLLEKFKAKERGADNIVDILAQQGGPKHIPVMMEVMGSSEPKLQEAIIHALGRIGHESALPALFKSLKYKNEDIREATVEAIGKIHHKDGVAPLIAALSDKSDRVKEEAVMALSKLKDKSAVEPIIAYLRTDADKWTLEALDKLDDRRAVPFLVEGLTKGDFFDDTAVQAMHTIKKFNAEKEAFEGLVVTAKNEDQDNLARITALSLIGKTGNHKATQMLLDYLLDKKESSLIRQYAAQSLGELRNKKVVPILTAFAFGNYSSKAPLTESIAKLGSPEVADLLSKIRQDRDSGIIEESILALGKIGEPESFTPLVELLQNKEAPDAHRKKAIRALGFMGKKEAIEPLTVILKSKNKHARQITIEALGQINSDLKIPALISVLKNETDKYIRADAAEVLGKTNNLEAIPVLLEALKDKESLVRKYSKEALAKISGTAQIKQYIQTLLYEEETAQYREDLVEVLSHFDQPEVVEALLTLLKDTDTKVRISAINALGTLKAETAVDMLLDLSTNKNENIQLNAIYALAKIGNNKVIPILVKTADTDHSSSLISALCTFKDDPRAAKALVHISMHARKAYLRQETRCTEQGLDKLSMLHK